MKKSILIIYTLLLSMSLFAQDQEKIYREAVCEINPTHGSEVSGTVTFTETSGGIRIVAEITGLAQGNHGFHIHENGDCTAPDATSAGGHFNPTKHMHGDREEKERHTGDMGNIFADAKGRAHLDYIDKMMTFDGENSVLGRSVIVHADPDDYKTQPTGNSGGRLGCGIIRQR